MTAQAFEIVFRGSIHFVAPPAVWWKDSSAFEAIRAAMQRAGLWLDLPNAGGRARKLRPLPDPTQIASWTTKWELDEDYALSRGKTGHLSETTLLLTPRKEGLQFYFFVTGADAESARSSFLDSVVAFARDIRELDLFGGVRLWDWDVDLQRDYPTPRPVLDPHLWSVGLLLMIVDREYFVQFSSFKQEAAEDLERVLAAPPPEGATREDHGPLAMFLFAQDLTDDAAIDRARAVQHRWLAGLVHLDAGAFTSERGDARVLLLASERHAPLTIYDAIDQHGYKAMFLTDDGGGDADLYEAARWLAAKQLPDGTPVHDISIIAPTREAAIAAADRVRQRGFNRLLYIDNNGELWNPFVGPAAERS